MIRSRRHHFLPAAWTLALAGLALGQQPQRIDGTSPGDRFGSAVAYVRDVDGDGCDELAIGAARSDVAGLDSGELRVYSGRTGALLWSRGGGAAGDLFGQAVASAGDLDGDGAGDVIVGAPGARSGRGRAIACSGRSGAPLFVIDGVAVGDRLGHAVAGIGDANGDGYDDVAVGAPGDATNGSEAGAVRAFSGRDGTALFPTLFGNAASDRFGWALAALGDVDQDGLPDLLVGAPGSDFRVPDGGSAFAFSGVGGGLRATLDGTVAGGQLGWAVAGVGDQDGDGRADFAAGAPFESPVPYTESGAVHLWRSAAAASTSLFGGAASGARAGWALSSAGDLDRDGFPELAIASPDPAAGRCVVLSVARGSVLFDLAGVSAGQDFGWSLAADGDPDGDGRSDLCCAAPAANLAGSAFHYDLPVQLGDALEELGFPRDIDEVRSARFIDDLDRDGYPELLVGAHDRTLGEGVFYVLSGGAAPGSGPIRRFRSPVQSGSFGAAATGLGDLDGDGYEDFAFGDPGAPSATVRIHSGSPGQTASEITSFSHAASGTSFGLQLSSAGDLDGDGVQELLVGAPLTPGTVTVWRPRDGGTAFDLLHVFRGALGDDFGAAVQGGTDCDGDGIPDLLIGAPNEDSAPGHGGTVRLVSGRDGSVLRTLRGPAPDDDLGSAVDFLSDLDGDGVPELLIGSAEFPPAPAPPPPGVGPGRAYVFSGATGVELFRAGPTAELGFGSAVRRAGDHDGDGFEDWAVGAPGAVYLFSGRDGSPLARLGRTGFAGAIDSGTDWNQDGVPDLVATVSAGPTIAIELFSTAATTLHARTYGAACPGSLGRLPRIGSAGGAAGPTAEITLRAAPPSTMAVLFVGIGGRQDLDLTPIGMPGCRMLFGGMSDATITATTAAGTASMPADIPNLPQLSGRSYQAQWLICDLFANRLQFVTSDGLEVTFGAQ
ncbi:MAG: FG-GAP repeat protein [Planctomycetes bacterium]|nr:FG-GAP repeat protein [Planctomycetota bacterium]